MLHDIFDGCGAISRWAAAAAVKVLSTGDYIYVFMSRSISLHGAHAAADATAGLKSPRHSYTCLPRQLLLL